MFKRLTLRYNTVPSDNEETQLSSLPPHILSHIFSFLLRDDLLTASLVNSTWKEASEHDILWKRQLEIELNYNDDLMPSKRYKKQFLAIRKQRMQKQAATKAIYASSPSVRQDNLQLRRRLFFFNHNKIYIEQVVLIVSCLLGLLFFPLPLVKQLVPILDEKEWLWVIIGAPILLSFMLMMFLVLFEIYYYFLKKRVVQMVQANDFMFDSSTSTPVLYTGSSASSQISMNSIGNNSGVAASSATTTFSSMALSRRQSDLDLVIVLLCFFLVFFLSCFITLFLAFLNLATQIREYESDVYVSSTYLIPWALVFTPLFVSITTFLVYLIGTVLKDLIRNRNAGEKLSVQFIGYTCDCSINRVLGIFNLVESTHALEHVHSRGLHFHT